MIEDDRLPWFHCYPEKLLGAMAGMSPDQQLVYVTVLLRIYEARGPCPDPVGALARRTGTNRRRVSDALEALFRAGKLSTVDGGLMNPFAEKVLAYGAAKHERLARAGSAGGKRKAENTKKKQSHPPSRAMPTGYQEDLDLGSKNVEPNGSTTAEVAVLDVRTRLFRSGLATLRQLTGKGDSASRSLIGKWLRNVDDDATVVLRAIEDAGDLKPADPIAWILAALKSRMQRVGNGAGKTTTNGAASLLVRIHKKQAEGYHDDVDATVASPRALPARTDRQH